jgi:DNA-binding XRE family transcriptional regulator
MKREVVERQGKRFVLVEEADLERLERKARRGEPPLPPLPPAEAQGNRPALDYIRASIARDIIRERKALGLTQAELAALAGVREETLCRLESGKHSPTVRTVEKIDRALKDAQRRKHPGKTRRSRPTSGSN